jgi:hypothetical protein
VIMCLIIHSGCLSGKCVIYACQVGAVTSWPWVLSAAVCRVVLERSCCS